MLKELPIHLMTYLPLGITFQFPNGPKPENQLRIKPLEEQFHVLPELSTELELFFLERGYETDPSLCKYERGATQLFLRGKENTFGITIEEAEAESFEVFIRELPKDVSKYSPPLQTRRRQIERNSERFNLRKYKF